MLENFYYMLEGHIALPVTFEQWHVQEIEIRRVAAEYVGDTWISTAFTGVNLGLGLDQSRPILFETMVFEPDPEEDDELRPKETGGDWGQIRYSTWEEAEAGHALVVALVRSSLEEQEG